MLNNQRVNKFYHQYFASFTSNIFFCLIFKYAILFDINRELINTYKVIKSNPINLINLC